MSSDRIENPAIADMDRHLDELAKDDQRQQDIEERARKMLRSHTDIAGLLELRDDPKILVPLSALLVATFAYHDMCRLFAGSMLVDPTNTLAEFHRATKVYQEAIGNVEAILYADALEPRYTDGKSAAEQLLDLDEDDGIDADPNGRVW